MMTPYRKRNMAGRDCITSMQLTVGLLLWALLLSFREQTTTSVAALVPSSSAISQNKNCIIVGGGPIGLATALTLARAPHSYDVTVLEATSDLTSVYDPTKSYLYNVNPRGLEWFTKKDTAPSAAYERLQQMGYSADAMKFFVVPADPSQPIRRSTFASPIRSSNQTDETKSLSSYWIPRHQLNEILYDCCNEHNEVNNHNEGATTTIRVISGKSVRDIVPTSSNVVSVQCHDGDCYTGALIVAADGINSVVRSSLAGLVSPLSSSWLQSRSKSFRVLKFKSPSTGLKFKALQFKPNLIIPNRTSHHLVGEAIDDNLTQWQYFSAASTDIMSVRGRNNGFRNQLKLGFLPMKDPNMIRLGNTVAPYDHEIWSLSSGANAKDWFTRNFPRFPWNESLINESEWDRYVQARATTFGFCQYSPGSVVSSPNGLCGVVMVGDSCKWHMYMYTSIYFLALLLLWYTHVPFLFMNTCTHFEIGHAFPPDAGQGINAGLQDVVALDRALRNVNTTKKDDGGVRLGPALLAYQKNRSPEHAALIRIVRFASPYQYRQPWLRDRIGAQIWTMNFLFRMIVNKMSFGFIPPAIFTLLSDPSLTYRKIMRRADITAFGFQFLWSTFVLRWMLLQRSSLRQLLMVNGSVEASAAGLALIILKGILPLKDQLEIFLRRERYLPVDRSWHRDTGNIYVRCRPVK